jgi:hypothetical protein
MIMSFLNHTNKQNPENETALAKEKAVYLLWEKQTEVIEVIYRARQAESIDDASAQVWLQEVHSIRHIAQDQFILARSITTTNEKIKSTISEFQDKMDSYKSKITSIERSMNAENRIHKISSKFANEFDMLEQKQVINIETKRYLYDQLKMYSEALSRNISNTSIRSNIRDELLHDLIDDFYVEIQGVYIKTAPAKSRI